MNNSYIPKIEIKGAAATGKSALAYAIKSSLAEHGITCEITGCEDERSGVMEAGWKKRIPSLKGKTINIETIRVNNKI